MPRKGKPMMSAEYQRAWRAKNPERVAVYNARSRSRIKGAVRTTKSADEVRAQDREWRRRWREKNRERVNKRRRAYERSRKEHFLELRRKWKERNRERVQAAAMACRLRKYGITLTEYARLLDEQGGLCAICRLPQQPRKTKTGRISPTVFCVDHDHDTGAVRGLLCVTCNLTIGNAKESIAVLTAAIDYLEKHQSVKVA